MLSTICNSYLCKLSCNYTI